LFGFIGKENDDFFSLYKIEKQSIAIARFIFYVEGERGKGRFISLNSNEKWYKFMNNYSFYYL
tara:strand:- start:739 stop:927 length:189 start_codon:yes stop_codon:yes gene_type:complete